MRRQDREITDRAKISAVIQCCDCCRVGFSAEEGAYILPLNFAYEPNAQGGVFYFHGATEGRKIELANRCPNVGFELDTNHAVHAGERACGYSFRFQSVIGTGTLCLVEDAAEKKAALQKIMRHYSDRDDWEFSDAQADAVAVLRLDVRSISCKEHL